MEFENVKAFAEQSKDLHDAIKEYAENCVAERKNDVKAFAQHSKSEMETLINKEFAKEVEAKSNYAPVDSTKTEIMRYSQNPNVKYFANQILSTMIDAVTPIILGASNIKYMADIKFADLGDTIKFDLKSSELFVVSKAGRRKRRAEQQKTFRTTVSMTGENHIITIGTTLFEILTNQSYIAEEVVKMALSMENAMYTEACDKFTTTVEALTGTNLAVANYSEASLITLCERVTALNGGRPAVILGTPVALKKVLPTNANYRYFLEDDYVKLGHVRQFNGYDVLPLEQVIDITNATYGTLKLSDSKIYVVSPTADKIVKIGVFGGTMIDESNDNANGTVEKTITKDWDVAVVTNAVAGVVESFS